MGQSLLAFRESGCRELLLLLVCCCRTPLCPRAWFPLHQKKMTLWRYQKYSPYLYEHYTHLYYAVQAIYLPQTWKADDLCLFWRQQMVLITRPVRTSDLIIYYFMHKSTTAVKGTYNKRKWIGNFMTVTAVISIETGFNYRMRAHSYYYPPSRFWFMNEPGSSPFGNNFTLKLPIFPIPPFYLLTRHIALSIF